MHRDIGNLKICVLLRLVTSVCGVARTIKHRTGTRSPAIIPYFTGEPQLLSSRCTALTYGMVLLGWYDMSNHSLTSLANVCEARATIRRYIPLTTAWDATLRFGPTTAARHTVELKDLIFGTDLKCCPSHACC